MIIVDCTSIMSYAAKHTVAAAALGVGAVRCIRHVLTWNLGAQIPFHVEAGRHMRPPTFTNICCETCFFLSYC